MNLRLLNGGNSVDHYYQLAWHQMFVFHNPTNAMPQFFLETEHKSTTIRFVTNTL